MARLPSIVTALSLVDNRDRATIDNIGRAIREAKLLPTTLRGRGAATMTARDAASLLIGANGADTAKDAPEAVRRFSSLVRGRSRTGPHDPEILKRVVAAPTFGEALPILIEGAPELEEVFWSYIKEDFPGVTDLRDGAPEIAEVFWSYIKEDFLGVADLPEGVALTQGRMLTQVALERHPYIAVIICRFSGLWGRKLQFALEYVADPHLLSTGFYGPGGAERRTRVTFGLRTLMSLSRALRDEQPKVPVE